MEIIVVELVPNGLYQRITKIDTWSIQRQTKEAAFNVDSDHTHPETGHGGSILLVEEDAELQADALVDSELLDHIFWATRQPISQTAARTHQHHIYR